MYISLYNYIYIYVWHKSRLSVTCFSSFWYVHLWRFFFSLEDDVLPPCLHTQQYMGAGCCWNSMDIPREFHIWSLARRFFESIRQDNIAVLAYLGCFSLQKSSSKSPKLVLSLPVQWLINNCHPQSTMSLEWITSLREHQVLQVLALDF